MRAGVPASLGGIFELCVGDFGGIEGFELGEGLGDACEVGGGFGGFAGGEGLAEGLEGEL